MCDKSIVDRCTLKLHDTVHYNNLPVPISISSSYVVLTND